MAPTTPAPAVPPMAEASSASSSGELLARVWTEIGGAPALLPASRPVSSVPLASRTATAELARASVMAATLAAGRDAFAVDPVRVAVAYRSDRYLIVDGAPPPVWSPLSGFWRSADGWIRTHGNYPHHADALRRGLRLGDAADADTVRRTLSALHADEAVRRITDAGGLAVIVRAEKPEVDAALRRTPLLDVSRVSGDPRERPTPAVRPPSPLRPLAGLRVLDLTRVIAGPVCTRTLALLGAEVLRIDPPGLPELPWQHLDTGHGKRTAVLDARDPALDHLIARADAVVLGYRPASLARLGLSPESLVARHPGLIVAELSAWGADHPDRAGFDSLVQAESGIALIEGDRDEPGALPAQALDHSSGYLLAAALTRLLRDRRDGDSWIVRTSLRRVAAELLGMRRHADPEPQPPIAERDHLARFEVDGIPIVTAGPAIPGTAFVAPHAWGSDAPRW